MGNSTRDGLGFEEVNQDITFTETISGTNIYATTLNGTTGSITSSRIGNIATPGSVVVTGNVIGKSRILSTIGTGSPITWGYVAQYGTGKASDVEVVISFGVPFAAAPSVVLTPASSGTSNASITGVQLEALRF